MNKDFYRVNKKYCNDPEFVTIFDRKTEVLIKNIKVVRRELERPVLIREIKPTLTAGNSSVPFKKDSKTKTKLNNKILIFCRVDII